MRRPRPSLTKADSTGLILVQRFEAFGGQIHGIALPLAARKALKLRFGTRLVWKLEKGVLSFQLESPRTAAELPAGYCMTYEGIRLIDELAARVAKHEAAEAVREAGARAKKAATAAARAAASASA